MNLIRRFIEAWKATGKLYLPSKGGRSEKPETPAPPPPSGEGPLKVECVMPTDKGVQWVCSQLGGRHTQGVTVWWEENREHLSFETLSMMVISMWEAGRVKADNIR